MTRAGVAGGSDHDHRGQGADKDASLDRHLTRAALLEHAAEAEPAPDEDQATR